MVFHSQFWYYVTYIVQNCSIIYATHTPKILTQPKLRLISGVGICLKLDADGKVKSLGHGLSVAVGE